MPITATRQFQSGSYLKDGPIKRVQEVWKVESTDADDGSPENISVLNAVTATGIPTIGESYNLPNADGTVVSDAQLLVVSHDLVHEPGTATYRVIVTYEGVDPTNCSDIQQQVNQIIRVVPVFRTGDFTPLRIPDFGNVPGSDAGGPILLDTDILGDVVDVAGKPTSTIRHTESLDLTVFFNTATGQPDYQTFGMLAGSRNNAEYLNASRGTLLYLGAISRTFRNFVIAITHKFLWDELYHLVQVPERDSWGWAKLEQLGGFTYKTSSGVFWRQPFPEADFTNINPCFNSEGQEFMLDIPRRDQML